MYFNATSDRRAKTNITPAKFSALQIVNSIPTYTFNYTNKEEKTLGLIAQEATEFDLDGFNMVDNLEATGQDGDFMQMKESKLVYVLWKAVQELSAEVEDLKSQIASLNLPRERCSSMYFLVILSGCEAEVLSMDRIS